MNRKRVQIAYRISFFFKKKSTSQTRQQYRSARQNTNKFRACLQKVLFNQSEELCFLFFSPSSLPDVYR